MFENFDNNTKEYYQDLQRKIEIVCLSKLYKEIEPIHIETLSEKVFNFHNVKYSKDAVPMFLESCIQFIHWNNIVTTITMDYDVIYLYLTNKQRWRVYLLLNNVITYEQL